jgi:hypothetical protein
MLNIIRGDKIKNRVILIGNGFDLAHGMPTRYEDFILFILKRDILSAMQSGVNVKNNLYEIIPTRTQKDYNIENHKTIEDIFKYHIVIKRFNQNDFAYSSDLSSYLESNTVLGNIESNWQGAKVFFRHIFLERSIEQIQSITWTGFETLYYETMLDIIHNKEYAGNKKHELEMITHLNDYFREIKYEFKMYIKTLHTPYIQFTFENEIRSKLSCKFNEYPYTSNHFFDEWDYYPEKTLLLNFNYTILTRLYLKHTNFNIPPDQIDIHGDYSNDIVFGYGDEIDENYVKIENKNNNEYLRHFKAFNYFQNSEYRKFLGFINTAPFEVCIMGHSCGLSDRVMLNTLFEHEYCKSIKIYYHKDESRNIDNYTEITQNISRHFSLNSRAKLREKIVPKDRCVPLLP